MYIYIYVYSCIYVGISGGTESRKGAGGDAGQQNRDESARFWSVGMRVWGLGCNGCQDATNCPSAPPQRVEVGCRLQGAGCRVPGAGCITLWV